MKRIAAAALSVSILAAPQGAMAWGNTGHRMVGEAAMRALPADLPAFLRTSQAIADVGELSREPDRSKGAGRLHDQDRSPAHYLDLDENGRLEGGPPFPPMPPTREAFETTLQAAGLSSWKTGYLPYAIVDRWQQLALDFAYWRVLKAGEANPAWKAHRAWFAADRRRREGLILKDLGELSHFVGDGSQPLHVTNHHDGWGPYPNPNGYTTARMHRPFESDLVQAEVKQAEVEAKVAPPRTCDCPIEQRTVEYLLATNKLVIPFYEMEKAGGLEPGDPRGKAFAVQQLAAGASELRDYVTEAWRASLDRNVGWKPIAVKDVLAGKVDPYPALYGID
jgi:hypothetical protein